MKGLCFFCFLKNGEVDGRCNFFSILGCFFFGFRIPAHKLIDPFFSAELSHYFMGFMMHFSGEVDF